MAERVKEMGLQYDFDHIVPANTFNAHRLIQYAKSKGLQDQAEERLFHAYFSEGKNIDDKTTLVSLAAEIGLDKGATQTVMNGDDFTEEVKLDLYTAHSIGIQGVPYFVFDDKYAVSGAQPSELFLGALTTTWKELHESNPSEEISNKQKMHPS
jgi:predicted DsbA family dithiol-disulfide isomerase